MRRRLLFLLIPLFVGCATTAPTTPVAGPATPPPASLPMAAKLPDAIHWSRNSVEHRAAFLQAYRTATWLVESASEGREAGQWAVILDADETVIDNSLNEKEQALAGATEFDRTAWNAWVERREAAALPGAKPFLDRVRALGGRIAIVTNRTEAQCPATEDVFRRQSLPFDVVLCKGEVREKDGRWQSVENGTAAKDLPPLEVVLYVGDNIHDFPGLSQEDRFGDPSRLGGFGQRFVILPNPMYGSWERNPPD